MPWLQVQKQGHLTDDAASRTELHNLADRFHTVLKNPIDTGRLASECRRPSAMEGFKCLGVFDERGGTRLW